MPRTIRGVAIPDEYLDHIQAWIDQVLEKMSDVDPEALGSRWELLVGFYLGRGLSPAKAHEAARITRAAKLS